MVTKYILAALSLVFFGAAAARRLGDAADPGRQARTWLIIAVMFAAVSVWLFRKG